MLATTEAKTLWKACAPRGSFGRRQRVFGAKMNLEKVVFGFFILLALTMNLAFVAGDIDNPEHHSIWLLFAAIVVNFIATGLKLGDRSQVGALLLATSLVADLQLIVAASLWTLALCLATSTCRRRPAPPTAPARSG